MKKVLSLFLSLALLLSITAGMSLTAFAGEIPEFVPETSGTCGANFDWTYDEDTKILTFTGDGALYSTKTEYDENNASYVLVSVFKNYDIDHIVFNGNVTVIGKNAFKDCGKLKSITIPQSVTAIGEDAFTGCYGLESMEVESGNTFFDSRNDCNAIIQTSKNTLLWGCKNTMIPNTVTAIGDDAFAKCYNLTEITIPNSVKSIGTRAFSLCTHLTEATIPNGVTSVGAYTFSGCTNLEKLTVPASVKEVGTSAFGGNKLLTAGPIGGGYDLEFGWTGSIPDNAFSNCYNLNEITIPQGVTVIGDYAFAHCNTLQTVSLPAGLKKIGKSAFSPCGLTSITIPDSVTEIGDRAFSDCYGLSAVTLPSGLKTLGDYVFSNCRALPEITIPGGVTSIGNYAFYQCYALTDLSLSDSVTSIGNYAFQYCDALTDVTLPKNLKTLGACAFRGCIGLKSVTFPNSLASIGQNAFYNCSKLSKAELPDSVTEIGREAFYNCVSMTSAKLPKNLDVIPINLFYNCGSLQSITMPQKTTIIGAQSFCGCASLCELTIPSTVTTIGGSAFSGCVSLQNVKFGGSPEDWSLTTIKAGNTPLTEATIEYGRQTTPITASMVTLPAQYYIYSGYVKTPSFTVKYRTKTLKKDTDYKVTYSAGRKEVGTYTITVTGIGKYSGKVSKTFKIIKPSIALTTAVYTYNGDVRKPGVTVKHGTKTLKNNTDYTLTYPAGRKNVGTYKITVNFKGAYYGTKTVSFKINPKGTTLSSVTAGSKKFTVKWKKQATKMAASVITGYQIQYSTTSGFTSGNKAPKVAGMATTAKTVSNLPAKKKYYVRIRTYKVVSGTTYYSPWSAKMAVTTK